MESASIQPVTKSVLTDEDILETHAWPHFAAFRAGLQVMGKRNEENEEASVRAGAKEKAGCEVDIGCEERAPVIDIYIYAAGG